MIKFRNKIIKLLPKIILVIALLGIPAFAQEPLPKLKQTVYITISRSSTRYHLEGCSTIKNSKVKALTIEDARKFGFTQCGVCKPGE